MFRSATIYDYFCQLAYSDNRQQTKTESDGDFHSFTILQFQIISHISTLNLEQVLELEDVRQRQIKTMRFFAILIFGTIFLSLSASIFITFKSNKFEVDSENEFCTEIEYNAKTVLDPKVRLKIIELKRKLPRPNDGDIEKIDEKVLPLGLKDVDVRPMKVDDTYEIKSKKIVFKKYNMFCKFQIGRFSELVEKQWHLS